MSQKRLFMRKIRDLLRLKYELGRSHREIATSLGIANSTASDYVRRASAAGFSWPFRCRRDWTAPRWRRCCSRRSWRGFPGPSRTGATPTGSFRGTGRDAAAVGGWSTEPLIRTAIRTAGSASATRRGGDNSTWSFGRYTGRARSRSSTTAAPKFPVVDRDTGLPTPGPRWQLRYHGALHTSWHLLASGYMSP